jgi:hypothetical protein
MRCTTSAFSPPSGVTTANLVFTAGHVTGKTNTGIFIDYITLETDTSNVGRAAGLDEYVPGLPSITANSVIPGGSFNSFVAGDNNNTAATYENWTFGVNTGIINLTGSATTYNMWQSPSGQWSGLIYLLAGGSQLSTSVITRMTGLSNTTTYNLQFAIASCMSATANLALPDTFTVTASCGTSWSQTLWNGLPVQHSIFQLATSTAFTPPSSSVKLTFTANRAVTTVINALLFTDVKIMVSGSSASLTEYPSPPNTFSFRGNTNAVEGGYFDQFNSGDNINRQGSCGPWYFAVNTGWIVNNMPSATYSYTFPKNGYSCGGLFMPSGGSVTNTFMATTITGLKTTSAYNIRFSMASCESSGVAIALPETFTVTVMSGNTYSNVVWNTLPQATTGSFMSIFQRVTSSKFTPPNSTVLVYFAVTRSTTTQTNYILIDEVSLIEDTSGVGTASTIVEYVGETQPITGNGTIPGGDFDSLFQNDQNDSSRQLGPWFFNRYTGAVALPNGGSYNYYMAPSGYFCGGGFFPAGGTYTSTTMSTVLSGLSTSNSYQLRFHVAKPYGKLMVDSLFVNVFTADQTTVLTVWQNNGGFGNFDEYFQQYTTSSFTPTQTSVRVVFSIQRSSTTSIQYILIDNVQIIINGNLPSQAEEYLRDCQPVTTNGQYVPYGDFEGLVNSDQTSLGRTLGPWSFSPGTGIVYLPNTTYNPGLAISGNYVAGLFLNSGVGNVEISTYLTGLSPRNTYSLSFAVAGCTNKSTMDNWLVSVCFGSTNYGIWNGVPGDTGYYYASPTNSFSPPAGHTTGRVIWKNSRNSGTVNQQWAILDAVTINITYNVPNAVSLVVANVQPNSIKVSWTVPTSGGLPSSFFVYKAGTYITSLASDATSYTYTGLSDGTTYTLGIAGNNSVGVGTTATVTQATTTTGPQLTGTTATTTAIAANWTLGAGNSATYTVYLAGNAVANVANTVTSYTFANLVPGTSYTVGATDNVNGIEGNMSTRTTSTIPLTVANLSLTPTTATTAFGSWKAPTGGNAITVYRAYINATKFGSDITYPTANVSLTGLVGSSSYIVSVAAVSAGGQGANSSANVSTIPGAPSLGTTVATTTSLTLPWTSGTIGNVPLDTYSVYIGNTLATTGNSTLANWTFSGLTSATNYIIGVSANNFVGTGLRSNVTVGTLPTQVSNIVVVPATTTAFARWSAPSPSTNITVYRVYVNGTKFGADITYPTANVNITSLVGGTYYNLAVAAVTSGGQGANAFSNITTIPTAPTIGNVVLGQTTLTMPWTITGNAVSSYNVYLSNVFVTSLASNTTTYTFSNLTTSTAYRLAVSAYDVSGNSGVSFVTKTTLALAPTIGNLTANATDITMEWSTIAANVAKYKLYRGSNNVGNVAANVSVYDFSGLAATTSYILGVSAVVDSTEGIVQTVTTATTPNPVTALTLTPASSSIYAAWTAPSGNGLSSYMAFVNGSQIGSNITAPASNVTLSGLTGASTYAVSIATVSSGGIGANTFANATTTPAAPTIGTLTNTANSIVMPWTAPVGGNAVIANYTVYKANVIFATVAANVTSYTFSNLAPTTAYILGIAASDSAGRGPVANVSTGTIPATPTIGNIRANATLVLMQWASVGNVSYYNMYLSGNYVANVASTSYTFTGLIDTTPYTMGVSAVISGVEGNIATVTSGTTPIAPVIGTLTTSITTVIMPWTAPATTGNLVIANYAVYKAGSFFATVPSDTTTYTFANLTQGTAYTLGVAALDVNGAGPIASTSTTTLTSAPTMGNVTSNASAISMQWSTIAGASYYNVYLSGNYVANVVSTSYTFSNLSNGTGYSVGVAGVTSGVEGGMVTVSAGTSPGTPVIGSLSAGSSTITMPWSVTGNIISNYSVYKGGIFVTTVSGTSYTYTGLTESTSYTLGVAATDAYGTGPTANVTKSTVSSAPALIGQPTVTVSSIALQWSVSGNASFYMMYLSGNNVANVTGRNTYTFSNLLGSTLYTVGTSSVTDGLESPVSTVSVPTQPGPPILANTSSTTTQFTVNWKAPTGGNVISNYRFYLGPNKQNGDLSAATTSYSMSGLPTASVFPYQISAVNSSGEGSRVQGNVSTLIVAPTVTANAAPSYRAVGIALSANVTGNAGVQGYKVYANGNLIAVLPSGTTTYNLSGLKGNTSYNIVVTAVDDYGTESVAANLTQSTTSRNEVLYALANTAAIVQSNLAVHSVSTKEVLGNTFSSIKTLITANASSDTTIRTLMQTYATTTSTLTTKCSTLSALAKQRKSLLKSMENA